LLFANFQKFSEDISENDEKAADSHMKKGLLHAVIHLSFAICKRVVEAFRNVSAR
jgi:hypothetical protein